MISIKTIEASEDIYANDAYYQPFSIEQENVKGNQVLKITYQDLHSLIWKVGRVALAILLTITSLGLLLCFQKGRKLWADSIGGFKMPIVYIKVSAPDQTNASFSEKNSNSRSTRPSIASRVDKQAFGWNPNYDQSSFPAKKNTWTFLEIFRNFFSSSRVENLNQRLIATHKELNQTLRKLVIDLNQITAFIKNREDLDKICAEYMQKHSDHIVTHELPENELLNSDDIIDKVTVLKLKINTCRSYLNELYHFVKRHPEVHECFMKHACLLKPEEDVEIYQCLIRHVPTLKLGEDATLKEVDTSGIEVVVEEDV